MGDPAGAGVARVATEGREIFGQDARRVATASKFHRCCPFAGSNSNGGTLMLFPQHRGATVAVGGPADYSINGPPLLTGRRSEAGRGDPGREPARAARTWR